MTPHVRDHIQRTRNYLANPLHWRKGYSISSLETSFCIVDAIQLKVNYLKGDTTHIVCDILREKIHPSSIVSWNDAPERTHADVIQLLDSCLVSEPNPQPEV